MVNPTLTPPRPPSPPEITLSPAQQLTNFRQMLETLEAKVTYYQDSIKYHQQLKEQFESELAKEKDLLETTKNAVASLEEFVTSTPEIVVDHNSNGKVKTDKIEVEPTTPTSEETGTTTKTKTPKKSTKTVAKSSKAKASTAKKSTKAKAKTKTNTAKTKTKTTKASTAKTESKNLPKPSKLPPSPALEKFDTITAAVLDFVKSSEGVIEVKDLVKHFYPEGLAEDVRTKVANSFSSVLSTQARKRVVERTVPGKYLWLGKK